MPGTITVGVDGTDHSLAAVDWAAAEASRRAAVLRVVFAWVWRPLDVPVAADEAVQREWAENVLREAEKRAGSAHPELTVVTQVLSDDPVPALVAEAGQTDLLVLGSRGHGALVGRLLGSVALRVLPRAGGPVVLVRRPDEKRADATATEIVVGVQDVDDDGSGPALDFAFAAAAARGVRLRAVRAWHLPPVFAWSAGSAWVGEETGGLSALERERLTEALRPWRARYPGVEVVETLELGSAGELLLSYGGSAALMVVGHRTGGEHGRARIGAVTQAVLHHAPCPVAVVPCP
ncbi:universal stress protein [Streptomyces mobaraensis NBRC 13819 = DSM 40847]|uniref:Universal stress protein n=2 Tax=Streptomyces mobaraensis TaxID=35621 RepID=A0A5N5W0E1_STRMB|nr:universal stress protein [Streptomyces mobaraensis]EMF01497.1 UspA domain-containing protein [Streptomyces mobaraensis NBRC 13819 = DSM 40847]KAB7833977.1 universal stress protein [Streptomyces mobaraensis]QTT72124.1 universal stress protein [Streptomyces mobaraensis NBRC 13819 = DSM 40847]